MRFMLRGRRNGKTNDAVRWLTADPVHRVLITHSELEAERVRRLVGEVLAKGDPELQINPEHLVLSAVTARRRMHSPGIQLRVDNLDLILRDLFGAVEGAYATIPLKLGEQFIDTERREQSTSAGCGPCGHTLHVGRCGAPLFRDVLMNSEFDTRREVFGTCGCVS